MKQDLLRKLPAVDEVLTFARIAEASESLPRQVAVDAIRSVLDRLRTAIMQTQNEKELNDLSIDTDALTDLVLAEIAETMKPRLRRVINATGVVVHTNLGRSIIARPALDALIEVAGGYNNLEYNIADGERGSRHDHIRDIIVKLTGAEDAIVVNNNAAAVLLALTAIAKGRDVIVSRGQLVEIGGSFRIPDVMRQSGANLVEVGSTNKTHLGDYRKAISDDTALILRVHTSNFKIVGFTSEVPIGEMVALGHEFEVPVMDDLGSGMLIELEKLGSIDEPTVAESVAAGVDIITFSGDKLLGGPQAGIMVGSKRFIAKCRNHPLARVVRVDKFTLAALEATLRLYLDPEKALREIPTLRMISEDIEVLTGKARRLAAELTKASKKGYDIKVVAEMSKAGGGALPLYEIPTAAVSVVPRNLSVNDLEEKLRANDPPIIARIKDAQLLLDVRTISEEEFLEIAEAFRSQLV